MMLRPNFFAFGNKLCENISAILRKYSNETNAQQNNTNVFDINKAKSLNDIPGPKPVPIFGSLWHFLPGVGKYYGIEMHKLHVRYQEDFGNIVLLRDLKFSKDVLLCYDPKDIETIFRNENLWPERDVLHSVKYYREHVKPEHFQGYGGVFTSEGEQWHEGRSILNSLILQPRVTKHFIKGSSQIADDFVTRIQYLSSQNELQEMPDDFNVELMKWALELIGLVSLDTRFGLLQNNPNPETIAYLKHSNAFFDDLYIIDVLPSLSKYISTPSWKKYIGTMDGIVTFIKKQVKLARERLEKDEKFLDKHENDMTVIETLVKNYEDKYVFGSVLDMILAGADTTSRTMGGILYLLASNPDKQEILRNEINKTFPNKNDALTIEKLQRMPYLKGVVKEGLRIYPVGGGLARVTNKDLILSGYHVPKGTSVFIQQLPLYSSEEHFSEAKKFKPERWLRDENNKKVNINPWVLLPFGFGPRGCVGRRIAQLQLQILTIKVMQNFNLEWHYEEPKCILTLLYGITSPLKIRTIPLSG